MKKLQIYLDETYNLQSDNQFFCIAGFTTFKPEDMRTEYKKILRKSDAIKNEIKSTDKKSEKIRGKILKSLNLLENIEMFTVFQIKKEMSYEYFRETTFEQEIVLYQELLKIILSEILTEYNENIEISINVEVDKNDKIKRAFYKELEIRLKEQHNIKWIDIETLHSNTSFGLQLADQVTGIVRENIKEKNYSEFIRKFKNIVINPLSKN